MEPRDQAYNTGLPSRRKGALLRRLHCVYRESEYVHQNTQNVNKNYTNKYHRGEINVTTIQAYTRRLKIRRPQTPFTKYGPTN